jgi:hypothetical protein
MGIRCGSCSLLRDRVSFRLWSRADAYDLEIPRTTAAAPAVAGSTSPRWPRVSDLPALATGAASAQPRHLRPVEQERRGAKFAAVDHDVARVLGPHRAAATCYGVLATAWYEFAPPSDKLQGKKRPAPGDWVEVDYRQFMEICGTNAKDSIIRWLRILAEDTHPCPWGRCGDEHPLIVVKRQGQNKPNRYRKWRCGEDELILRPRVKSRKLSEAARRRVKEGQILNGIVTERPLANDEPAESDSQLGLDLINPASPITGLPNQSQIRKSDSQTSESASWKSGHQTSESPTSRLPEVWPSNFRKSDQQTSLRGKEIKLEKAAAKDRAAAIDEQAADDVDAVACEVVDAILELAKRTEPEYTDDRAWSTARRLATAALKQAQGEAVAARSLLLRAIGDRRLARAANPVGLLIRGVEGDVAGADRFLVVRQHESVAEGGLTNSPTAANALEGLAPGMREALLDAVRCGAAIDARWLRGRDIPPVALETARRRVAEEAAIKSATPLCDELAARDETEYRGRLEEILAVVEIPANLGVRRTLDHPMLLGMCRARLERELCGDR